MDVATFVSLILGAALAVVGGIVTELWRQRRDRRSAARLVYHELLLNYAVVIAMRERGGLEEGRPRREFRDGAWREHAGKLALTQNLDDWQRAWGVYEAFAALPRTPNERLTAKHLDLILDGIEDVLTRLGHQAGVPQETLVQNKRVRMLVDLVPEQRIEVWQGFVAEGQRSQDPDKWLAERVSTARGFGATNRQARRA